MASALAKNLSFLFGAATHYEQAHYNREAYYRRTARNHYWVGGVQGQDFLHSLSIGVAGLGGMGSQIAEVLARVGVGQIRLADPDVIEESNINRQVIARQETIGLSKTQAAMQELRGLAKDFELVGYAQGIDEECVNEFVDGCDAIVDEIDVFPLDKHVLLHRAARKRGIPVYSAYVVGMGIHFYKFHGSEYTFEDFLGVSPTEWENPSIDLLVRRFGPPFASYLEGENLKSFQHNIERSGVPIFVPATLMGQSLVVIRMLSDLLQAGRSAKNFKIPFSLKEETPIMPEFLALDPVDLSFKKHKI